MVHPDEITQLLLCLSNIKASWRRDSFDIHCDVYKMLSVLTIALSTINIKTSLAPLSIKSREHDTVERSLGAMVSGFLLMTLVYDHRYTTIRSLQWLPGL
jgi:hypothetical protein